MRVPEGFKQTEVGVIPKDWEVVALGENVTVNSGESPSKFKILASGIPYFKVDELNNSSKYAEASRYCIEYCKSVPEGSLIFPKRGASIFLNKIRILKHPSYMDTNLMTLTVSKNWEHEYIYYQLLYIGLWKVADTTSVPQINNKHIIPFQIPLPPTRAEQTAIAAALSDMDALLEGVEKLLEKKRRIKQGAMQELLRPKEGWEIHKLDELCTPSKKRIDPKTSQQVYKCVELEHIGQESGRLLGYALTDELKSQKTLFNSGDTLFGKLRPYLKKFLFADFDGCCTTEIWALQATNYIYGKLLFYIIQTDAVLEAANQSEGTKMPRADWKKVKEVKFSIPPRPEQEEIAAILSDMDSEIGQLETKLAKYRQLKTGMMQELLTGKKRLV